jgi:pyruvate/2-oxoglutarate dehydrogenase complex dihydrolipoamide dehydrogenase (E3) component
LDYSVAVKRSRQVSDRLVKGVSFLMKKNNIDVHMGTAKVTGRDAVQVTGDDGTSVSANHSGPAQCPRDDSRYRVQGTTCRSEDHR